MCLSNKVIYELEAEIALMAKVKDGHSIDNLIPKATPTIHSAILEWFSRQQTGGKVLDVPAGYGHLSVHLKQMGFDVLCGEIEPDIFDAKELECVYVDLNNNVNMPNDSFDYICCVDGLEHMTNPYNAVKELSRVLKPNGIGIFSMPNCSSIEARLKFFTNGYLVRPQSLDDYIEAGCNLFNFHNSPITITLANFMFEINGLEIECILNDKVRWKRYLWFPFIMMLKLHAFFQSEKKWKKHRYDLTLKDAVILGGNTLIFITRKRKAP